jgi:hypothetical protein
MHPFAAANCGAFAAPKLQLACGLVVAKDAGE